MKKQLTIIFALISILCFAAPRQFVVFEEGTGTW